MLGFLLLIKSAWKMSDNGKKANFWKAINTLIQTRDNWYTKYKVGDSIFWYFFILMWNVAKMIWQTYLTVKQMLYINRFQNEFSFLFFFFFSWWVFCYNINRELKNLSITVSNVRSRERFYKVSCQSIPVKI